jgi:hypothetical protein
MDKQEKREYYQKKSINLHNAKSCQKINKKISLNLLVFLLAFERKKKRSKYFLACL